jgi:hypothetical protein
VGQAFKGDVALSLDASHICLGEAVELAVTLQSRSKQAQALAIDYAVHHVKADGSSTPKVFKGWTLTLAPGAQRQLKKTHAVKPITTRRYYPGEHRIDLRINGRVCAEAAFNLRLVE